MNAPAPVSPRDRLLHQIDEVIALEREAAMAGDLVHTFVAARLAMQLLQLFRTRYPNDPGGMPA